jgi:Ser/Thr protein kinase RdoA (MazF antagonist)
MNHFPIARSVLAADALPDVLQTAYGLRVTRCRLIKAVVLDSYLVETADDHYLFRVYPHRRRTRSAILSEIDALLYLHEQGVSVSIPIAQKRGRSLLSLAAPEGERMAALFSYAPGKPLSQCATPASVQAYGRLLAQVHQVGETIPTPLVRPALDVACLLEHPMAYLETALAHRPDDVTFLQQVIEQVRPVMTALSTDPPLYGFCHGDVNSANIHVAADGTLTLFDFDFCGPGWRVYDVATYLIDTPSDLSDAFLAGYQEIRTLEAEEVAAIPSFQIAQHIWMLGLRASYLNEWGLLHFSDRFIDNVLHFIRQTMTGLGLPFALH